MGGPAEADLVERARRGDAGAYAALVRRHEVVAFRTACVLCGSAADAEEACQDGFVKAWTALGRFRAGAPFRPWLLAIVANEARARARAEGRRAAWTLRAAAAALPAVEHGAEVAVLERERRAVLAGALGQLPAVDRQVLELRFLLELSEAETAGVLGCRRGTVKSRQSRALARLRAVVDEEDL